jgi:hypothetical protein
MAVDHGLKTTFLTWRVSFNDPERLAVYHSITPGVWTGPGSISDTGNEPSYTYPPAITGKYYGYTTTDEPWLAWLKYDGNYSLYFDSAEALSQETIGGTYSCEPSSGVVPFPTQMTLTLDNLYTGPDPPFRRPGPRHAGRRRLLPQLAGGVHQRGRREQLRLLLDAEHPRPGVTDRGQHILPVRPGHHSGALQPAALSRGGRHSHRLVHGDRDRTIITQPVDGRRGIRVQPPSTFRCASRVKPETRQPAGYGPPGAGGGRRRPSAHRCGRIRRSRACFRQ